MLQLAHISNGQWTWDFNRLAMEEQPSCQTAIGETLISSHNLANNFRTHFNTMIALNEKRTCLTRP